MKLSTTQNLHAPFLAITPGIMTTQQPSTSNAQTLTTATSATTSENTSSTTTPANSENSQEQPQHKNNKRKAPQSNQKGEPRSKADVQQSKKSKIHIEPNSQDNENNEPQNTNNLVSPINPHSTETLPSPSSKKRHLELCNDDITAKPFTITSPNSSEQMTNLVRKPYTRQKNKQNNKNNNQENDSPSLSNIAQKEASDINQPDLIQQSIHHFQDENDKNTHQKRQKKHAPQCSPRHLREEDTQSPLRCTTLQNYTDLNETSSYTQPSPLTAIRTINAPGASLTSQNFPPFSPDP